jgi:hypothetical protein
MKPSSHIVHLEFLIRSLLLNDDYRDAKAIYAMAGDPHAVGKWALIAIKWATIIRNLEIIEPFKETTHGTSH